MVGTDNISKILIDNITCEDLIDKYIEKKYNNNYSNDVFRLLIDNEYYILKFYKNKKKMENEIKISDLVMDNDYKVLYKGLKNSKYYTIRKYIEGKLLEDNEDINLDIVIKIGKELKKIHSLKIDSNMKIDTTEEIFLKWIKNLEDRDVEIDKIKKVFSKRLEIFNYEIAVTHMDFSLGNLIIDKNSELKVIDFETAKITDKYFDFVKIRCELKKYNGLWDEFKKSYGENLDEDKIDFYEFVHSIGGLLYIYSNNKNKNSFYFENRNYLNRYIEKYIE